MEHTFQCLLQHQALCSLKDISDVWLTLTSSSGWLVTDAVGIINSSTAFKVVSKPSSPLYEPIAMTCVKNSWKVFRAEDSPLESHHCYIFFLSKKYWFGGLRLTIIISGHDVNINLIYEYNIYYNSLEGHFHVFSGRFRGRNHTSNCPRRRLFLFRGRIPIWNSGCRPCHHRFPHVRWWNRPV